MSCGKHFPGYAAAVEDPHHSFPVIERSRAEMEANELAVFRHFAPLVDSMMIGHIHYGSLDPERRPASLSPVMIDGLLRGEMGFEGLVMTDDLDMGAIIDTTSFEDMLGLGLAAGNDLLMICHRVEMLDQARAVLKKQPSDLLAASLGRVAAFKEKMAPSTDFSPAAFEAINRDIWALLVATLGEEKACEKSLEDGKRSPVELY